MQLPFLILGYITPDTLLPITSVLAAAVGALLIFWNYIVALAKRVIRFLRRRES